MPTVKLSDGTQVTLKDVWTHAMQKAFDLTVFAETRDVTAKGLYAGWEAVFPMVIEKIEKGGQVTLYGPDWLGGIAEDDYRKLRAAADGINADQESAGEKNP
jgi:hypothetical protein